jgi:hypothetical protein
VGNRALPEFSFAFFVVAAGIGIALAFMEQSVIIFYYRLISNYIYK